MTESDGGSLINLDEWIYANRAATLLGVSRAWLKKLRDRGVITARYNDYAWLYYQPSLEAYANQRAAKQATRGE